MNTLTIKTDAPVEFMDLILKRISSSLKQGYKESEGEFERFMSSTQYKYSYKYENEDF